jgi:hypothetical protein
MPEILHPPSFRFILMMMTILPALRLPQPRPTLTPFLNIPRKWIDMAK